MLDKVWIVIIYNKIREGDEIKGVYDTEDQAITRAKNIADTTRNAPAIIEWKINTERRANRKYYVDILEDKYNGKK